MAPARLRYIALIVAALLTLHAAFYFSIPSYKQRSSISNWIHSSKLYWDGNEPSYSRKCAAPVNEDAPLPRANATFVSLVRNSDVWELLGSLQQVEDRFNHKYHYPIVFLNNVPFDDTFIKHTSGVWSGETHYGLVPIEHWSVPSWVDPKKANDARKEMVEKKVIYGGSTSYRHMCRYQSGFFYRHELLNQFKWYWRIEPNVKYFCDIDYDPFLFMEENNKVYGFTITIHEYIETVATLWDTVKEFMQKYPQHIEPDNAIDFISEDKGKSWNTAHFWSNFEIGSLDFWRGQAYSDFFDYLDKAAGFFYERWGDAPIHSIAACLFLKPEQIHFFDDIGYRHEPFQHCPNLPGSENKCYCNPEDSFDEHWYSFTTRWKDFMLKRTGGSKNN